MVIFHSKLKTFTRGYHFQSQQFQWIWMAYSIYRYHPISGPTCVKSLLVCPNQFPLYAHVFVASVDAHFVCVQSFFMVNSWSLDRNSNIFDGKSLVNPHVCFIVVKSNLLMINHDKSSCLMVKTCKIQGLDEWNHLSWWNTHDKS